MAEGTWQGTAVSADPLVTIVTPSFQQAEFLRATLDSVAAQNRSDIEHIVVDGGSTDGSVKILQERSDRLQWISEPDNGQSDALNKGFARARGKILAWINSDDLLLPGAVDAAVQAFADDPQLGMVCGNGYVLDEHGERIGAFPYTEAFNLQRLLHFGDTILQQSAFFSREAFDAVGGLNASLQWTLDWDLFIRIGKRFPVRTLTAELGAIRVHGAAKTSTGGWKRLEEIQRMLEQHTGNPRTTAYQGARLETWDLAATARIGRTPIVGRVWRNTHDWLARRLFPRMEECCGWLHDGWATERVELLLPRLGGGVLRLEGEAPSGAGALELTLDGRLAERMERPPGRFQWEAPVAAETHEPGTDQLLRLQIDANETVRRRKRMHGGYQRLCWKLHRVTLEGARGRVELPPPRLLISPDLEALPFEPGGLYRVQSPEPIQ